MDHCIVVLPPTDLPSRRQTKTPYYNKVMIVVVVDLSNHLQPRQHNPDCKRDSKLNRLSAGIPNFRFLEHKTRETSVPHFSRRRRRCCGEGRCPLSRRRRHTRCFPGRRRSKESGELRGVIGEPIESHEPGLHMFYQVIR